MRRSFLASLVAVALLGVNPAADAATVVSVPAHSSDSSTVSLLGASEQGFLVSQGTAPAARLLAGAPGAALTGIGSPGWGGANVQGGNAWFETYEDAVWTVHRVDLTTRATASWTTPFTPLAFTPDGWVAVENGALVRHVAGGAATTLMTGIDTNGNQPEAEADGDGVAVIYETLSAVGVRERHIALVTFGRPGVDVVWSESQGKDYGLQIVTVAMSSTQVGWTTFSRFGGQFVHQRQRSGGAITTTKLPEDVSVFGSTWPVTPRRSR